jgi:hypothetical protein
VKNANLPDPDFDTQTYRTEMKIVAKDGPNVNDLTDRFLGLAARLQTPKNVNIKTINVSKYCFFSEGGN